MGSMPWLDEIMQMRIDNALIDSQFIESFDISIGIHAAKFYINELIGRILIQEIHPDGFKEITLSSFSE